MKKQPTLEEAESYLWWQEYLDARTKGIKCMMVMGKGPEEIAATFNLTLGQCVGLMSNISTEII